MISSPTKVQYTTVPSEYNGQRLDNFLVTRLKGVPKSKVYRIIRKGEVRVNSKRVAVNYKLNSGDKLRIPPIRATNRVPTSKTVEWLDERIIHEDKHLMIIDKPEGLAVHGGSGLSSNLIDLLRARKDASPFLELVHRLDKNTSGCIIIAKSRACLIKLHEMLQAGSIEKTYHAIVHGEWFIHSNIKFPLAKSHVAGKGAFVQVNPEGKEANSHFKALEHYKHATLVEAMPITGRTHQLRVHAAYMGYPIIGDDKYLGQSQQKPLVKGPFSRMCLHAKRIRFNHPITDAPLDLECLPNGKWDDLVQRLNS